MTSRQTTLCIAYLEYRLLLIALAVYMTYINQYWPWLLLLLFIDPGISVEDAKDGH
jgi:hypothetical protein